MTELTIDGDTIELHEGDIIDITFTVADRRNWEVEAEGATVTGFEMDFLPGTPTRILLDGVDETSWAPEDGTHEIEIVERA